MKEFTGWILVHKKDKPIIYCDMAPNACWYRIFPRKKEAEAVYPLAKKYNHKLVEVKVGEVNNDTRTKATDETV